MMEEMIYCRACGREIHRTARSCPACGAPVASSGRYKDKTAATLLAFFCGGFGIHRFYLGQWWGIFYILFSFCFGLSFIVAFIEFIVFLCTSQESWDNKYNDGQGNPGTGSNGIIWAVVGIAVVFVMVAVLGIVAAIALPAYQSFTKRSLVSEGLTAASGAKASVAEYIASTGKFPPSLDAAGYVPSNLPRAVRSIDLDQQNQAIVINYNELLNNKSIAIAARLNNGTLEFTCYRMEMDIKYVPSNCRN